MRMVAITAAMTGGTGLKTFAAEFPSRFVDVGIAEEQAVGMAAGLSSGGKEARGGAVLHLHAEGRGSDDHRCGPAGGECRVRLRPRGPGGRRRAYAPRRLRHGVHAHGAEHAGARAPPTRRSSCTPCTALILEGCAALPARRRRRCILEVGSPARCARDDVALSPSGRMVGQARAAAELLSAEGIECAWWTCAGCRMSPRRRPVVWWSNLAGRRRRGRAGGAGPPGCHDACRHAGQPSSARCLRVPLFADLGLRSPLLSWWANSASRQVDSNRREPWRRAWPPPIAADAFEDAHPSRMRVLLFRAVGHAIESQIRYTALCTCLQIP